MEEWKVVPEYSKYEASTTGLIRDLQTKELRPLTWNNDFLCTNMFRDDGVRVLCKVHRIVALTFLDNPEQAHNVIHTNEDRSDNSVGNLKWRPKLIKEVVPKEVPTLTFLDKIYTYTEFCELSKCEISVLRHRLKAGWSVRECFTGIKEFTGEGYSGEGMWFTSKKEYQAWMWLKELEKREMKRKQKEDEKQQRLEERAKYKKYGVGVFENFPVKGIVDRVTTKAYRAWDAMLGRCYSPNKKSYLSYGAKGVYVCDSWLYFQGYVKWYDEQYKENDWHVDKDILVKGNKVYSPETCVMVPPEINVFFASLTRDGETVKGFVQNGVGFTSGVSVGGEKIQKYFKSEEEACEDYWMKKRQAAYNLTLKYPNVDQRVKDKLVNLEIS